MKEIFENADLEVIQLDAEEILVQSDGNPTAGNGDSNTCSLDFSACGDEDE